MTPGCEYTYLPELDIHMLHYTAASRAVVDCVMEHLADLIDRSRVETDRYFGRILIDNSDAPAQPVSHTINRLKEISRNRVAPYRVRGVILYEQGLIANMLLSMTRLLRLPNLEVRFFAPEEREAAIAWLLENTKETSA
ncbi:MAG: hypothetical protein OHK0046_09610 [Anaerolineae bacterium]